MSLVQSSLKHIAIQFLRALPGAANKIYQEDVLKAIRGIVCYNQGKLAIYTFQANEKHKKLKNKVREIESFTRQISDEDIEKLNELCDALSKYLDKEFRVIAEKNFEYLIDFFKSRCNPGKRVRVCIKAVEKGNLITLWRDRYYGIPQKPYPITNSTAFSKIIDTGSYYLCNNIPKSIIEHKYNNLRIHEDSVRRFYQCWNPFRNIKYRRSAKFDEDWQRCWRRIPSNGRDELPAPETCYKSTLVIPMTLLNDSSLMSDEFRQQFNVRPNAKKAVFGFLGLDHPNVDFFKEEDDVNLCYIFADILSLYLIQRLNYITFSAAFKEAQQIIQRSKSHA
ncbi:hypothetical protein [Lusitaniella coriacea]|uniref:hypothetical protein n=1 Tax=Lusitaniella coriacea TaxID=1983105 RepID=UPI003CF854BD